MWKDNGSKTKMKINEGYENCKECEGKGYIVKHEKIINRCSTCYGLGKLDWITNVTKNLNEEYIPYMQELVIQYEIDNKVNFLVSKFHKDWAVGEPLEYGRFANSHENKQ